MKTKTTKMEKEESVWVLGHLITLLDTSGDYDLALIDTPAHTPGPPPHYHTNCSEMSYILEGSAEFFIDGETKIYRAGEYVDMPPNTLHTFNNISNQPVKVLNIHSPSGFRKFFEELGVSPTEENAQKNSVKEELIAKTIQIAPQHDMHIVLPESK